MTVLSGQVTQGGSPIQGAPVIVIDTAGSSDPSQWSVAGHDVSDSNGDWEVSGLAQGASERYHAVVQYDDGSELYNTESLPFLSTPIQFDAPTQSLSLTHPTADISVESAIPDSDLLHARFDFAEEDGTSPVVDRTGNGYDLVNGDYSGVSESINGVQAGDFDAVDDVIYSNTFTAVTQPFTIFSVYQRDGSGSDREYVHGVTMDSPGVVYAANWSGISIFSGTQLSASSTDTNPHIGVGEFDGSASDIRDNGSNIASGDAGTRDLEKIVIGGDSAGGFNFGGGVGEMLVYDVGLSSLDVEGIEQHLADKWSITLA